MILPWSIRLPARVMLLAVLAMGIAGPLSAEDAVRTIYDIELQPDPRIASGKSAFLQGTATPYGHQFQVLGTELDQPIAIGLYTRDPSRPLQLRVVKDSFMEPERELSTDAQGRIEQYFRTYDGFKLWVAAEQPTDYQLVVWVGDALVPATTAPAVVPASEYVEPAESASGSVVGVGGAGWSKREMIMAAVLALVLLIGGAVLFLRRKPAGDR